MKESDFQAGLIKKLEEMFPGCYVNKNDANQTQGFPDLTILYKKRWAVLECKKSKDAPVRPNQPHYVEDLNKQSFARFICPENEEEVLNELQQSLRPRRKTRVSKSE